MSHHVIMSHQFRTQFAAMFCGQSQQSVFGRDVTSSRRSSGRRQNSSVYELVGVSMTRCESRDTCESTMCDLPTTIKLQILGLSDANHVTMSEQVRGHVNQVCP